MKTLIANQKWLVITLLTVLIVSVGIQNVSYGQTLNVGEPRTVRLFYFLPNDRPYRQEVVDDMKTGILEVQSFFSEQMAAHGHGNKTFQIETDDQGDPIVHRVNGDHGDSHYRLIGAPGNEISRSFDNSSTVQLVVMDISRLGGLAIGIAKQSGIALVHGGWDWRTAAHELGHAFGLHHDFRDNAYMMSYSSNRNSLSTCAADFLVVNPYFNSNIPMEDQPSPTIELLSTRNYMEGAESIPIRLRVTDLDGLHQVFLYVYDEHILSPDANAPQVKACRLLSGETDTIVEFSYDGELPSDDGRNLSNTVKHKIGYGAVDMKGNANLLSSFYIAKISPQHITTFEANRGRVHSVDFSPDDTTLAFAHEDGSIVLWDMTTEAVITTIQAYIESAMVASFSPDGTLLASSSFRDYSGVKLWNTVTHENVGTLTGHRGFARNISFSPDGTMLAFGSDDTTRSGSDRTVRLWDVATHTNIATIEGHTSRINSVAFSPDGTTLASISSDRTLKLWDVATHTNIATLEDAGLWAISFSPDGAILALPADSTSIKLWDVATHTNIATLDKRWTDTGQRILSRVTRVVFSPDGSTLAAAQGTEIRLWDVASRTHIATFTGHTSGINSVAYSHDGTILASASSDRTVKLWDTSEWAGTPVVNHPPTGAVTISGTAAVSETLTADASAVTDPDGPPTLEFSYQWLADLLPIVGATFKTYTLTENEVGKKIRVRASYIDGLGAPVNVSSGATAEIVSVLGAGQAEILPVSQRTSQVRHAIVAAVPGINFAADVTTAHLAMIKTLSLSNQSITSLKEGDFAGLSSLTELRLGRNQLSSLPVGVFDGLSALTQLWLYSNQLSSLPVGVFDGLSALTDLNLYSNQLSSLPVGVFDGLSALTRLILHQNQLSSLPVGVFDGLSALTDLNLQSRVVARIPLTVSLEKVADGQFKAVAPTGAPFDIVLPINVPNGSISGGATTITIPTGSVESEVLTVTRTPGTTGTVAAYIGTLPGLPTDHQGYALVKSADLPLVFPELGGSVFVPVRERPPAVRDAIVNAVPNVNSAADVTEAHLAAITELNLRYKGITSLKSSDFDGLTALATLNLSHNDLSSLPDSVFDGLTALASLSLYSNDLTTLPLGIFDDLTALTSLSLYNNDLTTLPSGIFDDLTALTSLSLYNNDLTTLPLGIFDDLTALTSLSLYSNDLTTLPSGIFDDLTALTSLRLDWNDLTTLPEGVFDRLTVLTTVNLSRNTVDPLPLTVSLQKVGEGQLKAVAPAGAPFELVLPLTVTNGSINGGATSVTIPAGSVESEVLTVTRTPDTTGAVTVNIGTLPSLPSNHRGYALVKSADLPLYALPEIRTLIGSRTPQVRDAIVAAAGVNSAADVTEAHLAAISSLNLSNKSITSLKIGDFDGLSGLTRLVLEGNRLTTLPSDIFDGLTALTWLDLGANQFTSLPSDIFDGLTALTYINLNGNDLTSLPADIFEGLTALNTISLGSNDLTTLPARIFDGLGRPAPALMWIGLTYNDLTTLPDGIFEGLTSLTHISLYDNPVDPLPLTVSLQKVADGQFKAVAPAGAPFDIVLPLTVTNGYIRGGTTSITLSTGSVESDTFTVTRTAGTTANITVNIGTLPSLPSNHRGYALVKSADLPLYALPEIRTLIGSRTPEVRDAIIAAVPGVDNAADVTEAHLAAIESLTLDTNGALYLREDDFSGLSSLMTLEFRNNGVLTLPEGVFTGLSSLTTLRLFNNGVLTLPEGVFTGLSSLTTLEMRRRTLTVTLTKVGEGQFKAVAPTGAPFDIVLPISITNGSITGGATTLTITKGSMESDTLTVTHTSDAAYAVSVDIGTVPGLPANHSGYTLVKSADLPLTFPELGGSVLTPVSERTPEVRDAIVRAAGVNSAADVTETHLAAITRLSLAYKKINGLKAEDFDGLSALVDLRLDYNNFTTLPDGIFDGVPALKYLNLIGNKFTTLPDGIFDGLSSLKNLRLATNQLSSLPENIFDGLSALNILELDGNALTTIPKSVSGLTTLTHLYFSRNRLTRLPDAIFEGLSSLTQLHLTGNAVDPMRLTVSLEKVGDDQFKAVAPAGAPFDFVLPIRVTNGSITDGATTLTIPAGSVESNKLIVTRTPDTTGAVTVNIGTLPGLPSNHSGYALVKSADLPLSYALPEIRTLIGSRTPQVRDAIIAAVPGVDNAADVTETHLAAITLLDFGFKSIRSLTAGDFDGLTALEWLNLPNDTQLSTLPAGIFDDLTALTSLNLSRIQLSTLPAGIFDKLVNLKRLYLTSNQLSSLPAGIFDKLTNLTELYLDGNPLSTLPADIFDKLTALTKLELDENQLSTLPVGIFDKLSNLTFLNLYNNQLSSLPVGIFDRLTNLTNLYLSDNPGSPFSLTVSLEKVADGQFKAVAPAGAPFEMVLPLTVANGNITGGATTVTIPKGSVESEVLTVTRASGATFAVTVDIGTLPGLPANHSGYALVKSADLPITVTDGDIPSTSVLTLTVGAGPGAAVRGYNPHSLPDYNYGSLSSRTFVFKGVSYTLYRLKYNVAGKRLEFQTSPMLRGYELHLDSHLLRSFSARDYNVHIWDNVDLNWSVGQRVRVRVVETTPIPPGAPTNLTATPGYEKVTLSWELPSNADPTTLPVTEYEFRVSSDGGNTWNPDWKIISSSRSGNPNRTSYTIGGGDPNNPDSGINLANGTLYTFEIRARGGDGSGDAARITVTPSGITPISQRTPQVRDAIVRAVPGVNNAADVTETHLAVITSLSLSRFTNITTLKAGDFDGLTGLTSLDLSENQLSTLPEGIFDDLTALTLLKLHDNQLSTLPADIFDALTKLQDLQLHNNQLSTLPAGTFDGLSWLGELFLQGNQLTTLPAGIFDKLTGLRILNLEGNQLSTLPAGIFNKLTKLNYLTLADNRLTTLPTGIFEGPSALWDLWLDGNRFSTLPVGIFKSKSLASGFSSLRKLYLEDNTVNPLPLTLSLEKVANGQFKAVAPAGATFDFALQISVANGTINGGTTTITIPKGSVESETFTVTRTAGTTDAVTVDISYPLPELPTSHQGYALRKSADLPLEIISASAPQEIAVNIPDPNLRTKIESALGKTAEDPITATEMATLTSLNAQDSSISDLTGLETATRLITLKLGNNTVSDISALVGLTNLTELHLWDNQITNLSALSGLTDLTKLYLWGNSISDISHLSGLTNLRQLRIGENSISNIAAVSRLTDLTYLSVKENSISNISAVAGLTHLTQLQIGNNTISDITSVQNLTNLEWLDMPNNRISDISAVQNLTQLVELYFQNNAVSDLSPLVANTGLGTDDELDVRGNPLSYPSIYTHIPALQARNVYVDFDNRVATTPVKISGDTQSGNTGTTLTQPFVVEVRDGSRVAFAGVPITFTVTAGGGRLSTTNTTTDTNGRAESTLTLGNTAGANTVRVSVAGITQTITFTATATTTNTAPVFTDGTSTTRAIAENTAAGVNIGTTVAATDADNDTLTYTLSGDPDATAFAIDTATGQLQTKAALDYETKSIYTVTITVSDGSLTDTITVTISITDVADTPVETAVNISDANLRAKIESALRKTDGDPITATEMATLTSLNAQDSSISDLTGLETATNLTTLKLGNNSISDISALSGLTSLTELQLWDNQISNLSILASLTNLTKLYIWGNGISDISALAGLTSLTHLKINGNSISNISILSRLTNLTELSLNENAITDISAVAGLTNLTELLISNNTITNITPVQNLTKLVWLDMLNNRISDISAVQNLTSLRELYFQNNAVSDLSPLVANTGFGEYTELDASGNPLNYPSIYTHIPALQAKNVYIGFDNRVATTPVKISGDTQSGNTDTTLAQPFVVEVRDGSRVAFAGVPVTFTVTAGGGRLSATNTTTDTNGRAESTLTLGNTAGTNTVRVSVAGITQTTTFTATATTTNTAPVFTDGTSTTRAIAENTAAGVSIGTAITATDADNDTLTYTLSGADAAAFSIDNNTGQLRAKSALDYETKHTYTVIVTVSDGSLTDAITITINVTDITEVRLTARFEALPASHDGSTFTFELHFSEQITISYRNVRDDVLDVTGGTVKSAGRLEQGSNRGWKITIEPESNAAVSIVLLPTEDCDAVGAVCTADRRPLSSELSVIVPGPDIPDDPGTVSPIINHTPQVRDAIVAALPGINSVNDVTEAHLATITSLNLRNKGISTLNAGDLDGLTALTELRLQGNQLRTLPANIFADMSSLKTLDLGNNQLTSLSPEVFSGLTAVTDLHIHNNQLATLPQNLFSGMSSLTQINIHSNRLTSIHEDAFSGLPSLTQLFLRNNRLTSLPQDVFSGLSKLQYLYLDGNQLTSLPTDVFSGLSSLIQLLLNGNQLSTLPTGAFRGLTGLTLLQLQANSVAPMPLTVSLEKVAVNQFKATAPAGAPFAIILPVRVANGSISGSATTLTIPQGAVESAALTVRRTLGTTRAVTVDIGTFPGLPAQHQGYELVKSTDLPLTIFSAPSNSAPVFTDGASTTRTIAENTAAGINIGTAITATDAENSTLTYTLNGPDASSFDLHSTTGQLKTKAALDYETKASYTVTITVSDGSLTDTISVTINVIDVNDTGIVSVGVPVAARTSQVRDAIVAAIPGVSAPNQVTAAHLAAITSLNLRNAGITALQVDDFSGMTALTSLNLFNNQLSSLPPGIFEGLTALTTIRLGQNAVDPLPLTVSLEKVGEGAFKAVAPAGATFNYVLPITVANGTINGGATTLIIPHGSMESGTLTVTRTAGTTGHVMVDITAFPRLPRTHYGYALVKSDHLPLAVIRGINTAPVFSDGTTATRFVAENTTANTNIGTPITATDVDNDRLTYTLSGTDAAAFSINSTTGQLRTRAALDYETKAAYSVTVAVSDGYGGSDSMSVTINITDIHENRAPVFTDGTTATRTVAENTAANTNIGTAIAATDADNDTLTYTLSGTDAAAFRIVRTTGQLRTRAALDYETKAAYSVTISVSDGNGGSDSITVTINITDIYENQPPVFTDGTSTTHTIAENTAANVNIGTAIAATDADNDALTYTLGGTDAAAFSIISTSGQLQTKAALDYETKNSYSVTITVSDGSLTDTITVTLNITDINELPTPTAICRVGDILAPGESCTYPDTDAVFSVLDNGNSKWNIPNYPWLDKISADGSMSVTVTVNDENYHFVAKSVVDNSWEIEEIGDDTPQQPDTSEQPIDTTGTPTLSVSTAAPLTEATLHGGIVTLNLSSGTYGTAFDIRRSLTVSGITSADFETFSIVRVSDTQATVELEFDGNISRNGTLTFNLRSDAIANYDGTALIAQISVPAVSESVTASTASPLTEATLDESIVTLTLSGRKFESSNSKIRRVVSVSGISGVTVGTFDIDRESDTEVTVELTFNGNLNTDGTLTFTVGPGAIAGYNGPAFTAQVAVSASEAPVEIVDPPRDAPQDDTPPSTDTRTTFEATTPPGYTRVTLTDTGSVWGIPTQYTTDSNVGAVAYMVLAKLTDCNFADAEVDRRSIVYIKRQSLGQFNSFASETVCGKTSSTWSDAWDAVRITHLRFYDETSLPNIKEAVYNATTGQIEIPGVWQQPPDDTTTNTAPVFTDGASTRRTIAENTAAGINIGTAIAATDADNDALTYILSGTDAVVFSINSNTGQLRTKSALDYETKHAYTVKITVSDGNLTDTITVTINVTDIEETIVGTTAAPLVNSGDSNTELVISFEDTFEAFETKAYEIEVRRKTPPEDWRHGCDTIRNNESSAGTATASFGIRDLEPGTTYQVRYRDTNQAFCPPSAANNNPNSWSAIGEGKTSGQTNTAPAFADGATTTRTIAENTTAGANIGTAITAADADNDALTYTLSGTDAATFNIVPTTGQLKIKKTLDYETKRTYTVKITVSDGSLTDTITVTINVTDINEEVGDDGEQQPEDKDTPEQPVVTGGTPTVTASTASSLTEAALNGSVVTLTLSGAKYSNSIFDIRDAVSVSGINGVTKPWHQPERKSDTELTVKLEFDGTDFDSTSTLTFTVNADAIAGYNGPALTAQVSVSGEQESVVASTAAPLTEATLDKSVVTLTLSGRELKKSWPDIREAVSVTGITGVTVDQYDIDRESDTEVTVELTFEGNLTTDGTLTFTVGAKAIADYNGPALTAQIPVTAVSESVTASTAAALTEATLHESVVTLTLSGRELKKSWPDIREAVSVTGITGVTVDQYDIDRESDTEVTVELTFDSNLTIDGTLRFTVGADAIVNYNGPELTTQITIPSVTESVVASTNAPLTETTLDGSIVTLTLSGRKYASSKDVRDAVSVSGIPGVTIKPSETDCGFLGFFCSTTYYARRVSDTEVKVTLEFEGDIDTDGTLTFTVGPDAIAGYNGPALTVQISVSEAPGETDDQPPDTDDTRNAAPVFADGASTRRTIAENTAVGVNIGTAIAATDADNDALTYTLGGTDAATFNIVSTTGQLKIKKTLDYETKRTYTVKITVSDGSLTDTITVTINVTDINEEVGDDGEQQPEDKDTPEQPDNTGGTPTLRVSTAAPLTEATLHGGIVTLNLSGGTFESSSFRIRNAVSVSGITGVTVESFGGERISDTQATIELEYDGNMTVNGTLTISVGAGAIKDYNGATLTAQIPVTANTESVVASTNAALTEVTLDESVVTLTLSGAKYASSIFDIRDAVSVSGINGVTKPWHQPERKSDTELTVKLEFDGTDFDSTSTLTFTVNADAIAGYNGPALTTQISVTAVTESVVASTPAPLKEATLDGSTVTLTLSGAKYARSIWDIRDGVTVSGITGVTMPWNQPDRKSDTQITIELEFDGNMNTDGILTFTVGADAIENYNGSALTAQVTVTADRENALLANFPNPFNPETWIPYQLAKPAEVTITIYAIDGQVVRQLVLGHQTEGMYQSRSRAAYWDGKNEFGEPVASGVYFYRLTAGDFTATRKMLIRK